MESVHEDMMDTYQTGRVPKKSYCLQISDKRKENGGAKKRMIIKILEV